MSTTSFIGKGTVYLQVGANPLVSVGNVNKLAISVSEDRQEQIDYESAGGGVADSVSRIKSMGLDMNAYSFSQENLQIALRGTSAAVTGGVVTDEAVTASKGGLNVLAKLPDASATLTVDSSTGTAYTEGTDYIRTRSGFTIPSTSTIADKASLLVSYTAVAGNALQGLTTGATNVRLVFEGLNEARSGKAVVLEFFKVQFSPTAGLDLISDKFADITLKGLVLKDETKSSAAGASAYFTMRMAA